MADCSSGCHVQVLQWTLQSARAAWAQPEVAASLASPAAFFSRYIALQPNPTGGVVVRAQALQFCHPAVEAVSFLVHHTADLDDQLLQCYTLPTSECHGILNPLLPTVNYVRPKVGGRGPRQNMYHEMHIIERSLRRFAPALPPPVPPSEAPKTAAPPANAATNLSVMMPHLQWAIPVVLQVRLVGSPSCIIT